MPQGVVQAEGGGGRLHPALTPLITPVNKTYQIIWKILKNVIQIKAFGGKISVNYVLVFFTVI